MSAAPQLWRESSTTAAQARVWTKRLSDRFEERRAKARELVHRQARDAELAREARQAAQAELTVQEADESPTAAAPAADLVPPAEPVAAAESIVPAFDRANGADAAGPAEPPLQQPAAIQRGRRKRRRAKSGAGGEVSRGEDEGAKP